MCSTKGFQIFHSVLKITLIISTLVRNFLGFKCKTWECILSIYKHKRECVGLCKMCPTQACGSRGQTVSYSFSFFLFPPLYFGLVFLNTWVSSSPIVDGLLQAYSGLALATYPSLDPIWMTSETGPHHWPGSSPWPLQCLVIGSGCDWQFNQSHAGLGRGALFQQWKEEWRSQKLQLGSATMVSPIFQVK